ncbi:anthrax toxin-like adenylyl cyclase domain-containing protein [Pandoraea anhela]|uniref:Calmodulin-sensitive adenylate cyclase n=1 Tax=Pandoraea anhela TaxID=2508295 RepID=A0A5E4W817_9BURK|nr:anthrax toxin-like adenylyl cyclase domain-containing protein [Pandoraea anhela]VVE19225.1 Calmodulin-sensitive adenylate cyclase [Pandoraea anhela]
MQISRYGPPAALTSQTATPPPTVHKNRPGVSPVETSAAPDVSASPDTPQSPDAAGLSETDTEARATHHHDDSGYESYEDGGNGAHDAETDAAHDAWRIGSRTFDQLRRALIGVSNARRDVAFDAHGAGGCDATTTTTTTTHEIGTSASRRRETSMPAFAEAIQRVSNQYNVVIGLRRPNALGQSLLHEGFPTKNFHVKAKSSASGPTAGFVPVDAKYAKVDVEQWEKQAKSVASALKAGAKAVGLRLSPARVAELLAHGAMRHVGGETYQATYPAGEMTFSLRPASTGAAGVHGAHEAPDAPDALSVFDAAGQPVTVLTNPPELPGGFAKDKAIVANPLPMTADYDLFCLFSRQQRDVDRLPMPVQPRVVAGPKDPSRNLASQYLGAVATGQRQPEDPNMGNISFFHRTIVDALNTAVARDGYRGGKLFWHNAENGNPFSPGFASVDAPLFFIPDKPAPLSASSLDDLTAVMGELQALGYAAKLSPRLSVHA